MNIKQSHVLTYLVVALFTPSLHAAQPKYTIEPITQTQVNVPVNKNKLVVYKVTNNTSIPRSLRMTRSAPYLSQMTTGIDGLCAKTFALKPHESCLLGLIIDGAKLSNNNPSSTLMNTTYSSSITVCTDGSSYECSQTSPSSSIGITTSSETALPLLTAAGSYSSQALLLATSSTDQQNYSTQTIASSSYAPIGPYSTAASCSGTYCAVVGKNMFAGSTNTGATWSTYYSSASSISYNVLNAVSCSSQGCVATQSATGSPGYPSMFKINSSGSYALILKVMASFTSTSLTSISCNSSGYCVAAGGAGTTNVALLGIVTPSSQVTQYAPSAITDLPTNSPYFYSVSANPSSTFFAVIGVAGTTPFIAQSTNNGSAWGVLESPSLSSYTISSQTSNNLSCTSSGVCVASGLSDASNNIAFAQTIDNGSSWTVSSVSPAITNGIISAVSCSGDTTTSVSGTVCVAVGSQQGAPLVLQSLAGGAWSNVTPSSLSSLSGSLNSVSCTGDFPNTACTMTGQNTTASTPILTSMLYSSSDGTTSISWFLQENLPTGATLSASATT